VKGSNERRRGEEGATRMGVVEPPTTLTIVVICIRLRLVPFLAASSCVVHLFLENAHGMHSGKCSVVYRNPRRGT
jgi:hypothetical protein